MISAGPPGLPVPHGGEVATDLMLHEPRAAPVRLIHVKATGWGFGFDFIDR